jgi:hypothetical protein
MAVVYCLSTHGASIMKRTILAVFALALLFVAAAQPVEQARVVGILPQTNSTTWLVSVCETGRCDVAQVSGLTNELSRWNLHHGDLILLDSMPTLSQTSTASNWRWLFDYSRSNRVAVYVHPGSLRSDGKLSIPVYHWSAPFQNPRTLTNAVFFSEGKALGRATEGFDNLLRDIATKRPKNALILGSLSDVSAGFGPFERPYENQQPLLDDVLRKSGTRLQLEDPLVGF